MPKGFTLIELLVAISILAIISVVGIVSYQNAQSFARDARRKQDLKAISVALELYYDANQHYPPSDGVCSGGPGDWCVSSSADPQWIPGLDSRYISSLPHDPRRDNPEPWFLSNGGYAYYSNWSGSLCPQENNQFYGLVTTLENPNDPDRNGVHHYTWCSGEDTITDSRFQWSPNTYVIISKF